MMRVMILAAGRGKRMGVLTDNCPKPLLKIGCYSLIEWQIKRLAQNGFKELVVNHAYLGAQIEEALGDGRRYGVNIRYSPEPEGGLETAGGIIRALPLLGEAPFLLVNADVWCKVDYARFVRNFRRDMFAHLLLVATPDWKIRGDFDLAGERVISGNQWTYSGIAVIHPRLLTGAAEDFLPLAPFFQRAVQQGKLSGEIFSGDWQDVGTPQRLFALQKLYR